MPRRTALSWTLCWQRQALQGPWVQPAPQVRPVQLALLARLARWVRWVQLGPRVQPGPPDRPAPLHPLAQPDHAEQLDRRVPPDRLVRQVLWVQPDPWAPRVRLDRLAPAAQAHLVRLVQRVFPVRPAQRAQPALPVQQVRQGQQARKARLDPQVQPGCRVHQVLPERPDRQVRRLQASL